MNKAVKNIISITAISTVVVIVFMLIKKQNKNIVAQELKHISNPNQTEIKFPTKWQSFDFVTTANDGNKKQSIINSIENLPVKIDKSMKVEIVVDNGDKKYNGIHPIVINETDCGCDANTNQITINIPKSKTANGKFRIIKA